MTAAYAYTLFRLMISASLPLPEICPASSPAAADLTIHMGTLPPALDDAEIHADLYQMNKTQLLYHVPGIARYLVREGCEIVIDPAPGADEASIRLFLLNEVLGAALHQRRVCALRATALDSPRGAVLLLGVSGAGKSTMAAALIRRGWRLLSDDVSVITLEGGQVQVLPGAPVLRLWGGSLAMLGIDAGEYPRVRPGLEKYLFPVESASVCAEVRPLYAVYHLTLSTQDSGGVAPVDPLARMTTLQKHLYPHRIAVDLGTLPAYWALTVAVAEQARFTRLARVALRDTPDHIAAQLDEDMR